MTVDLTPRLGAEDLAGLYYPTPPGAEAGEDLAALVGAHRGQARFAYRLAQDHGHRLLHVFGLGWHYWDGTRWAPNDLGAAQQAVLEVLRTDWVAAMGDRDLAADVRACQSAGAINGVLEIAGALPQFAATVKDLDRDPYLLNVANGTLDLRTMQLGPHDPTDRLTKVTTAAYIPDARSHDWDEFLARVLPDPDVRAYLQRFVGVSLLGAVREQEFTIATGTGANGKGVAYGAILHALGDYGHTAEADLFMSAKSNANAASPAVMALRGRRLVVCSETEQDRRLASALMKNLTGGDPITARGLHRDPVTFDPSHSVLMVTNYLPRVNGSDPAVWRRMRVVPFDVTIPEEERDPGLGERLRDSRDAILAWAVAGWVDYQAEGMAPPAAVLKATAAYRERSDAVARFIADRLIVNPHMWVTVAELWAAWERWAAEDGADTISKRDFSDELDKRGWPVANRKSNGRAVRARSGIGLVGDDEDGQ